VSPAQAGLVERDAAAAVAAPATLWTPTYRMLCASIFLIAAHQALLTPAVPLYVHALGGSTALIGVLLVLFHIVSVASRPIVGHWADTRSVPGVLALGGLILCVTGLGHLVPIIAVLAVFGTARGLGWAAVNTSSNALVAHVAPPTRRAETSSYFNLFQNSAHGVFPALAVWLIGVPEAGFNAVFLLCAALPLAAAGLALNMQSRVGTLVARTTPAPEERPVGRARIYDRRVLLATFLLACVMWTSPATQSFLPLHAQERGVFDVGWYYLANVVAGIAAYALLGRLFDRIGRSVTIAVGFLLCTLGIVLLLALSSVWMLLLAGVLIGLGSAVVASNTMALAIERADPRQRGVAFGTYTAAYSLGQGIGALLLGFIAELGGFPAMYGAATAMSALGLVLTLGRWSSINGRPRADAPALVT